MVLSERQLQVRGLVMGRGTPYLVERFNPFRRKVRASQTGERAWGHGSWSGSEWAEQLIATFDVVVSDDPVSMDTWMPLHQKLAAAMRPIGDVIQDEELRFVWGGREYVIFGRPRSTEPETAHVGIGGSLTRCAFVGLDPLIYDAAGFTETIGLPTFVGGLSAGVVPSKLWLDGSAGTFVSTPDSAALSVTGDIDLRWFGAADDWTPASDMALVSKHPGSGQSGYELRLTSTGRLMLLWGDGAGQTFHFSVLIGLVDGVSHGVRATLDVDNGAGGYVVRFFTSDDDGETWAQLGSDIVGASSTTIATNTDPLRVGARVNDTRPFAGSVHRVEVRDGIDGTIVAFPRFDRHLPDASSFVDRQGNTWTLNGAARFSGGRGGGLVLPAAANAIAIDGHVDVVNEGTADPGLTLRIAGPVSQPRVSVQRPDGTTETLRYLDDVPAGRFLLIDTTPRRRSALLDGLPQSNVRGRIVGDWPLLPGNPDASGPATSTVLFRSSDNRAAGTLTVSGASAWW